MTSYLITGASRGLGLAIATELAALPESEASIIFATTRQHNPGSLKDLAVSTSGRVVPVQLDPNDPESLSAAVKLVEDRLQGKGLDVLVNNAGTQPVTDGKVEMADDLTETFHVNVTLTHYVTRAFLPLLRKGEHKMISNISSTVGSIAQAPKYQMSPTHAYKVSKAAMNMLTIQYALQYADEGFSVFAISPGWLKTELGGSYADLPVEVGAKEVVRYIRSGGRDLNGRFLNIHVPGWENAPGPNQYDGKDVPW
ncbi:uncharacterized protein DSM5745_08481 [Aspergillus mulundensis]|uniref:Short chain oxidoreductase n=1 Tax=Aspergillus mulundensis TaxID=1810919 RepID=A0A3D8R466_9EURO|nr:Uncharacterized protein DSM5745_08481 [Aspergillus mulundensis]RDW68721.1 Uncharacterized protein DSM5745_08481 [Aspergillus mulundensis]